VAKVTLPFAYIRSLPPADQMRLKRDFDAVADAIPAPTASSIFGIYGDGSDGAVTFDGSATVLGLVPAANVYTLTRDLYLAGGSQLTGTTEIRVAAFRVFCNGTLTLAAGTSITSNGTAAVTSTPGVSPAITGTGYLGVGSSGGGGSSTTGASSFSLIWALGGSGGTGGASGASGGGVAGTITAPAPGTGLPRNVVSAISAASVNGHLYTSGTGGGGGAGGFSGTTGQGGGGGGGGGVLGLYVQTLVNNGTISVAGGAGAAGWNGGNAGGGGGGGGGVILLITAAGSTIGILSVAGGAGAGGIGTGTAGSNGSAGQTFTMIG
jgi:hypothetical protein